MQWDPAAADLIVQTTNGYPAHLQLFADHAWRLAEFTSHTITVEDARRALRSAAGEVEERTLGPRLERLSDRQAELLTAIAVHGGAATTAESHGHAWACVVDYLLPHPRRAHHRR